MDTRVIVPLARFEAARLVRHPAFLAGVVLTLMAATSVGTWLRDLETMTLTLVLLAWATLIAVDLATLRSRRRGTDELLSALPVGEDSRTAGHLASTLAAALVAVGLLAIELVVASLNGSPDPMPPVGPLAIAVIIVVGGGVVGVFAARWLPHLAFGYLAIVVTMYLQGEVSDAPERVRRIALAFVHVPDSILPGLAPRTTYLAHGAYLLGLVALVAVGASARRRFGRGHAFVAVVAVVLVAVTAFVQVRPLPDDQRDEAVALLVEPAGLQRCTTVDDVEYCAYTGEEELVGDWAATLAATLAPVPVGSVSLGRVTQRAHPVVSDSNCRPSRFRDHVPAEVAALAPADAIWPRDGLVHPGLGTEEQGCSEESIHFFHLAVQVGSLAVGLPPTMHGDLVRCTADGQARAALALWLGAQAVPDGDVRLEEFLADEFLARSPHLDFWAAGERIDTEGAWDRPPQWGTRFLRADVDAARRLMTLPHAEVTTVVRANWATLAAPATSTSELLALAGLDPQDASAPPPDGESSAACP